MDFSAEIFYVPFALSRATRDIASIQIGFWCMGVEMWREGSDTTKELQHAKKKETDNEWSVRGA